MAYKILDDCNNCTACEPVCPNSAITMGDDVFTINPNLCTECVGFYGEPQCAAVCPIEVCVADPKYPEDEVSLLTKAKAIHPHHTFDGSSPSRFKS